MENENQVDLEESIQEVSEENTQEESATVEPAAEESKPEVNLDKFDSKDDPNVFKIDLDQTPTNETEESNTDNTRVVRVDESPEPTQEQEEVQPEAEVQAELSGVEEVTEEEVVTKEEVMEALDESEATGKPLPENVQKLIDFMDDTGGDINDYVRLNRDVQSLDDQDALLEY